MLFFLDVLPGLMLSSACQRVVKSSILAVVDVVIVVAPSGAWQPCLPNGCLFTRFLPSIRCSCSYILRMVFLPVNYIHRGVLLHDWVNDL